MAPTLSSATTALSTLPSLRTLASRAVLFFMSTRPVIPQTSRATYLTNTVAATQALQAWYNSGSGLWDTTGWWNSANVLTTLGDFAAASPADSDQLGLGGVMSNTFNQAQRSTLALAAVKTLGEGFLMTSSYTVVSKAASDRQKRAAAEEVARRGPAWLDGLDAFLEERGFAGFINDYYDDEGWWALGLIRAYDVTGTSAYLQGAQSIFDDMRGGWSAGQCGGGILWSKAPDMVYVNAIANELYIAVAAGLANRAPPDQKAGYLDIARTQWGWFKGSGMINAATGLINDGLTPDCKNNGGNAWSYNQGVILGALVELNKAMGGADPALLQSAGAIADAAVAKLVDKDGVLHDSCEPNCGADGNQFKGVFLRNLGYLNKASPKASWKSFIMKNADAIWAKDRNPNNQLGAVWSGPVGEVTAATHSSAMDALVAALGVAV